MDQYSKVVMIHLVKSILWASFFLQTIILTAEEPNGTGKKPTNKQENNVIID